REVPGPVRGTRLPGAAHRRDRHGLRPRGDGAVHRLGIRAARALPRDAAGRVRPDRVGARMSDVERHVDDDYGDLNAKRNRRIRLIAWTTIIALILGGGGATVLSLLLG